MKQLSLLTLLLCLLVTVGFAQGTLISGVVLNGSSQPVANQVVYATDSTSNMVNPMFIQASTNASGQYSMQVPATVANGATIHVFTFACGQTYYSIHTYSNSANITANFNICSNPAGPYHLQGNITLGGLANNGLATLYLIRKTFDSIAMDWTLTAIDTIHTSSNGAYNKQYSAIPAGNLLVKASLDQGHPQYNNYLPTYYTSALNWSGATSLSVANFTSNTMTNINMTAGTNPGGPGFIGGYVLQGANKPSGVGDPLSSRLLLLTTSSGQAVAYTYSNAQGQFSFPSLAYGTYKLFGDAWGKNNPQLTVTISANAPSVNNVTFEENSTKFEGHIGTTGIGRLSTLPGVSLFPNPAADYVQLTGLETIKGDKSIVLTSLSGAVILKQSFSNGQSLRIATVNLAAGMYLLQLRTEAGDAAFKLVK